MTLQERHERILDGCVESLKSWKSLITEHIEDEEECAKEIKKLKEITENYCDIHRDFKKSLRALQKVEEQLNTTEENSSDIKKMYDDCLNEDGIIDERTNSEIWQRVFEGIDDVMEVKKKKKKLNDSAFEEVGDADDSLLCSNVFTPPIDPISKAVVREPVRNRKCKHVYERAMIVGYIKQQKRKAKCPYIGCSNKQLLMSDIVDDTQLQSQITQYMERRTEGDDTEDDD